MKAAIVKPRPSAAWSLESWRDKPIRQQPAYSDQAKLAEVEQKLKTVPPLTSPNEAARLKRELAEVCEGRAFLLQGGDCAESFAEYTEDNLRAYARVMLQMTMALMYGAGKPVVKVGRIAGQFSKPRSEPMETLGGVELPSYKGDMINGMEFTPEARYADPERLLHAYYQSGATLNFLRALFRGSFASIDTITRWNTNFVSESRQGQRFSALVERIDECVQFIKATGLTPERSAQLSEATFYTSHEALLLGYESSLARQNDDDDLFYSCSAHMLWIGDRTRHPDEAHVEFLRGLENPIGCKVGPSMTKDDLLRLCDALNPKNEAGRLTFISRMGAGKVADHLPMLVRTMKDAGRKVIWSCDPMHGNTIKSPNGYKTRKFNDILSEVRQFFQVHQAEGTYAGGVHFEMTGQDVTECLGGAQAISEVNLSDRYHTHCDPRLNASQSLELAFLIAEELRKL
ncbi:MAG: 3-deoxy-7-phosphoheptulonate synthase class II [Rickettsiales bacterium]|nr:3-deoxy-7-phosphoheptulonate synthase class II [Rickettsiales bacterium]